jgi:hypothetical protein
MGDGSDVGYDELLEELRDRVRSLENQLADEREANRDNRRIIAGLVQRIPELEPPREPSGSSVIASEGEKKRETHYRTQSRAAGGNGGSGCPLTFSSPASVALSP